MYLNEAFSTHEGSLNLTAVSRVVRVSYQVPGGEDYILVSTGSIREVTACANTPNSSLFDASKTAEFDRRVLELLKVSCPGTRRRG